MGTKQHGEARQTPTKCSACPIRGQALFEVISDDYLNDAESRRLAQYQLPARGHLYQEKSAALTAYTLFDGWLLLYRSDTTGNRQGLRVALPGDFVGYSPDADADYSHSALAVTPVVVCAFRQVDLHEMIARHGDLGRKITNIQARYLATCESHILGLGRRSAEHRIARTIVELYARLERRNKVDRVKHSMPFPLTQEMLGELNGLTPVHTNRVLRKLRDDKLLLTTRNRIEILDMPRLVELAEYEGATLA